MSDFNLSDKAVRDVGNSNPIPNYYWEEDVKEFIRSLKEDLLTPNNKSKSYIDFCEIEGIIDKLAGKDLI